MNDYFDYTGGVDQSDSPRGLYPVWPLWYVAAAFVLTRGAGALFVLGLVLNRAMGRV